MCGEIKISSGTECKETQANTHAFLFEINEELSPLFRAPDPNAELSSFPLPALCSSDSVLDS